MHTLASSLNATFSFLLSASWHSGRLAVRPSPQIENARTAVPVFFQKNTGSAVDGRHTARSAANETLLSARSEPAVVANADFASCLLHVRVAGDAAVFAV